MQSKTKVKELLNIRINEHSEHNYFVSPLAWPLYEKAFLTVCLFKNGFGIRLNTSRGKTQWKKICHPFERLGGLSVWKNVIHSNGLGYPFEKVVIGSIGLGDPFKKEIVDRLSNWSYYKIPKISPSKHKPHKLVMQKTHR